MFFCVHMLTTFMKLAKWLKEGFLVVKSMLLLPEVLCWPR